MLNFHYRNPARIFFGDGAENNMYDLLKEYKVTSLMFVYSGDFIKTLAINLESISRNVGKLFRTRRSN